MAGVAILRSDPLLLYLSAVMGGSFQKGLARGKPHISRVQVGL